MFVMRFDVRAPDFGTAPGDLYAAALDLAAFAEANGFAAVVMSEDHDSDQRRHAASPEQEEERSRRHAPLAANR